MRDCKTRPRRPEKPVEPAFILDVHQRMFRKLPYAGKLKTERIVINGRPLYHITTLPPERCEEFLAVLCARTNAKLDDARVHANESIVLSIAEFLCDFLAIHPFQDGNGRVARLLSTYLLERYGYRFARFAPIDSVVLETRADYYEALCKAQSNWLLPDEDLTPWIWYYVKSVYQQCRVAWERVIARQAEERDGLR